MGRAREILATVLCVALSGCGWWWEEKIVFTGVSPGTVLEIQQPFPANGWGMRIVLKKRGLTKVLYEVRGDVFLNFADVAWSTAGQTVTLFTCGTPGVRFAYNLSRGEIVSFAQTEWIIAEHIRRRYSADVEKSHARNVFEWACSSEGENAFHRAYPSASAR